MTGQMQEISWENSTFKVKIRIDVKGAGKPGKLFFSGKPVEKIAEENREHCVTVFRNIPIQGLKITNIDVGADVYTVLDEDGSHEVAFAPIILDITAESLENLVKFIARDDFRTIEVLEPGVTTISKSAIERIYFKIGEEIRDYKNYMEKKFNIR